MTVITQNTGTPTQRPFGVLRRSVLRGAVTLFASGASVLTAACGGASTPPVPAQSGASGTVEFWYAGLGQTFIDAYNAMAKSLAEKNPKISVNVLLTDGFPDKVVIAAAAGSSPDSFNIQLIDALTFLPKGIYEPLDTHIKARKYDMKALWPGLAEQYQYQGKQLVLWSQATVTMLHYNADLFRDNGLVTPSDLAAQNKWTWDACLDSAQKLTKEGLYGFWSLTTPQSLQPWLWMNGGAGFDSEEKLARVTMASNPSSLAAMQWQADIRNRYRVAPTPRQLTAELTSQQAGFANRKLAMYTEQSNIDAVHQAVQNTGAFKWDLAPLPAGPKGLSSFVGGQSIGVCAGGKNKDASLDWLFWAVSPPGQIEVVKRQIGVPVLKAMLETPEWKTASTKAPHANAVVDMMSRARPIAKTYLWRTLATNAFNENITKMNNGDLSAKEACQLMDDLGTKTLVAGV
ncbi:MAG TPA: extracellular solute-binding protein [Chloroflexota bacterium]|nr:extracellular solute-binding protein [Chloroflexota bacterium]